MTDEHEKVLHGLLNMAMTGWLGARHEVDALSIVVATEVPNWQEKVRKAFDDPARRQMTENGFAQVQEAVDWIVDSQLDGEEGRSVLLQAVESLHKKPN